MSVSDCLDDGESSMMHRNNIFMNIYIHNHRKVNGPFRGSAHGIPRYPTVSTVRRVLPRVVLTTIFERYDALRKREHLAYGRFLFDIPKVGVNEILVREMLTPIVVERILTLP